MNNRDAINHLKYLKVDSHIAKAEALDLAIKALERPKGKWINFQKSFLYGTVAQCSLCDNTLNMDGVNAGRGNANFCPNCGADMRGNV